MPKEERSFQAQLGLQQSQYLVVEPVPESAVTIVRRAAIARERKDADMVEWRLLLRKEVGVVKRTGLRPCGFLQDKRMAVPLQKDIKE